MKSHLKLNIFLMIVVSSLVPVLAQAFNPAAHLYIADRVYPFALDKIDLYYCSTAPDLSMYVDPPENWTDGFMDTHYTATLPFTWWKPVQRACAKGWQTHNEIWGADHYAHGTYPNYDGYVILQAEALATQFPILHDPPDFELAHFAIEVAIDLLLIENDDHYLGQKLVAAALLRSPEDLNLMAKAFVSGNNPNLQTLSAAESTFRNLIITYAKALSLPDPFRMMALGEFGYQISQGLISPAEVQVILRAAMDLCEKPDQQGRDYSWIVQSAIKGIGTNPALIR